MRLAWLLAVPAVVVAAAPPSPLVAKASPVAAPCVAAAIPAFERETGQSVRVETTALGPVASAAGADVVVGADEELTRILEGLSEPAATVDVASVPWVFVGAGATAPDVRALARSDTRVRVLAGTVARHARESLQQLPPERVRSVRDASALRPLAAGELALVPLSLAEAGAVSPAAIPPLLVRAAAISTSRRTEAARRFLEFLTGSGNAAFRACGRDASR